MKIINGHEFEFSKPNKILFPQARITKGDVITYYEKIAPFLLPHVKKHIIVMHRFVDGITKEGFYQKQIPDYFPKWIPRKTIKLAQGGSQTLVLVEKKADLVYLAGQYVIVFHSWLSAIAQVYKPDKIVFDLDPSNGNIRDLRFAARKLKTILEARGLIPFLMTSGSRGYHIVAPIISKHTFEVVHAFTKQIAAELADKYPDKFTIHMRKIKRKKRIFIDYFRNAYGQTSVAPYSLRAKKGAPVATPIAWDELGKTTPQKYTLKNIFRRLAQKQDPWKDFAKKARHLKIKK